MYNQQSKVIKRELIQFGTPIFGQIKDEATQKPQDSKYSLTYKHFIDIVPRGGKFDPFRNE